jgi:hypothetical protein
MIRERLKLIMAFEAPSKYLYLNLASTVQNYGVLRVKFANIQKLKLPDNIK